MNPLRKQKFLKNLLKSIAPPSPKSPPLTRQSNQSPPTFLLTHKPASVKGTDHHLSTLPYLPALHLRMETRIPHPHHAPPLYLPATSWWGQSAPTLLAPRKVSLHCLSAIGWWGTKQLADIVDPSGNGSPLPFGDRLVGDHCRSPREPH